MILEMGDGYCSSASLDSRAKHVLTMKIAKMIKCKWAIKSTVMYYLG